MFGNSLAVQITVGEDYAAACLANKTSMSCLFVNHVTMAEHIDFGLLVELLH